MYVHFSFMCFPIWMGGHGHTLCSLFNTPSPVHRGGLPVSSLSKNSDVRRSGEKREGSNFRTNLYKFLYNLCRSLPPVICSLEVNKMTLSRGFVLLPSRFTTDGCCHSRVPGGEKQLFCVSIGTLWMGLQNIIIILSGQSVQGITSMYVCTWGWWLWCTMHTPIPHITHSTPTFTFHWLLLKAVSCAQHTFIAPSNMLPLFPFPASRTCWLLMIFLVVVSIVG